HLITRDGTLKDAASTRCGQCSSAQSSGTRGIVGNEHGFICGGSAESLTRDRQRCLDIYRSAGRERASARICAGRRQRSEQLSLAFRSQSWIRLDAGNARNCLAIRQTSEGGGDESEP